MEKDKDQLTQSTSSIPTIITDCKDMETLAHYAFKLPDWPKKKYLLKDLKAMTLGDLQQLVMVCPLSFRYLNSFFADYSFFTGVPYKWW